MDLRSALREAMERLRAAQVPSHALAAELLLMHALGRDRAWIYAHPEEPLDPAAAENYFAFVARRAAGEPVQYITGKQEFWGLEFEVTPAVLIPRPETEHVIEVALARLAASGALPTTPWRIADACTGSGCLAVALALELPRAEVFATDISGPALEVARRNAGRHGVLARVHFLESNLLEALLHESRPFDLVVSNPPYVATGEASALPPDVREHEPPVALFAGPTGIEIYARLIEQAAALVHPGGIFVAELGYGSAERVREMFRVKQWRNVSATNDLTGIPRVIAAERAD